MPIGDNVSTLTPNESGIQGALSRPGSQNDERLNPMQLVSSFPSAQSRVVMHGAATHRLQFTGEFLSTTRSRAKPLVEVSAWFWCGLGICK